MLALSDTAGVILLVLGVVFVLAAGVALVLRSRVTREPSPDIPPAMEPGPSDPALETPLLQKLQGWGVVLVAFFVVWLPYNWLIEPSTNLEQEKALRTEAIERGRRSVELFSEENQLGVGCVRCHGPELRGGVIPAGHRVRLPAEPDHDLRRAVDRPPAHQVGRPTSRTRSSRGAATMPSWSIRYQGALDDQQINDIVNYLVNMSSKNVPFEDNICINPDAVKAANSPSASPAGTSGATGSTGATGATGATGRRDAPDARAGSAHLPRVPHRVRHAVQGRGRDDHGVHPVRRQRVPDALARVRQVDGVPGARGLLLGMADHPLVALVLRLLGPGARHADQPGAARPGAVLGRAGGGTHRDGCPIRDVRGVPGRRVGGAERRPGSVRAVGEQRRHVVPRRAGERAARPAIRSEPTPSRGRSSRSTA